METTPTFAGLACLDCGARAPPDAHRCPSCAGLLGADYDESEVPDAATIRERPPARAVPELLPFDRETAVSIDEGATPATDCPTLAADLGVESVRIKDEGRNPTGALTDRGLALAVTAAREAGAETVALATTGNGGQSAAAYAGRAGLASESFVPSRSPFVNKAMINVHGGEMTVVEGRYPDAVEAFAGAREDAWTPVGPASPYRREGAKTLLFELLAEGLPDAVVVPASHGVVLAGLHAAGEQLRAAGVIEDGPRLYAAQAEGCAPIATGATVDRPDTIVGSLEVPDPVLGERARDALAATGGGGVAVEDSTALEAAVDAAAETGLEVGATGGVAVAGARKLADEFDADERMVVLNSVAGGKEDDLLRSHLMSQGV